MVCDRFKNLKSIMMTNLKTILVHMLKEKNKEILDIENKYRSNATAVDPTSKYEQATKENGINSCSLNFRL